MNNNKNSYKQILKATSLFGGVQALSVLISISKSKIAAILIGVSGIGVFGVLSSSLNLIMGLTRLGLDISSVKEIASVNNDGRKEDVSKLVSVTMRLTWFTGVLGAIIIMVLSPWLSIIAFGNKDYTFSFIIISIAVLFNQLTIGNMAVLQGLKSLKKLAVATVLTSFFSLLVALILYYFIGEKGIPLVITITAFAGFVFSKYYVGQLNIVKIEIPFKRVIAEGHNMLKLGFVLSLGSLVTLLTAYLIQIFITNKGSISEVGLYNAGFVLINSYVSVFFNALSKDFFPRLSEVSNNNKLINKTVNEQALITVLLITPIIILFLVFRSYITIMLYTKEFLPILGMITYGVLGTIFKAVSWSMGFIIIVKGDSFLYLKTEVISNLILLILMVFGYNLNGLTGLGLGYLIYYVTYFVIIKLIVTKKYQFSFNSNFNKIFYLCTFQCAVMLYLTHIENEILKLSLMALIVMISVIFTVIKLNTYVDFFSLLKNKIKK